MVHTCAFNGIFHQWRTFHCPYVVAFSVYSGIRSCMVHCSAELYAPNVKQSCIIQEFKTYQAGSCRWNCSCHVSVLHQCRLHCSCKVGSDRHQILHTGNPYMHLRIHKKMLPKNKEGMYFYFTIHFLKLCFHLIHLWTKMIWVSCSWQQ